MLRIEASRTTVALASVLVAALALTSTTAAAQRRVPEEAPPPAAWIESGPSLAPGQPAQLGYESPHGSYLTILRANTNGDLSVVYPANPNSRSTLPPRGSIPMRGDGAPGVGYLFWITSPTPFDFRGYSARDGRWSPGRFGSRGGDPFEQVDRFARGTTRGRYDVGYSSYRIGAVARGSKSRPAIHDGEYGGYGGGYADGYAPYDAYRPYGGGASGDYAGWWGGPQWDGYASDTWRYRQSWRGRETQRAYDRTAYSDPRSRYLRHCADGTLAPYTVPCGAAASGSRRSRAGGRGRP